MDALFSLLDGEMSKRTPDGASIIQQLESRSLESPLRGLFAVGMTDNVQWRCRIQHVWLLFPHGAEGQPYLHQLQHSLMYIN